MENKLFKLERLRDRRGRYCTRDTYLRERTYGECARLRLECEKYMRMYLAVADANVELTREIHRLREQLKSCNNGQEHCMA